ncbi:S-receptor-like serine/threonine-protein kinase [Trema orientale]|uniref:Receptor-like serine/threonine-protein kinase n=1 Tax=Trema orientale TaxID=63057 RepID=A0A2P5FU25_TREOI|nr:S-receptor-like serine/threonine-protein kinase [Trema orientale]
MVFFLPSLLFSLLFVPFFVVLAQTNSIVRVGDSLTAGDQDAWWLSPTKDFAFGFQQVDNDHFLLAIWYFKLPERTVVWNAIGTNPAPRGSKVELTADSGLVLTNPQGDQELWISEFEGTAAVRHGVMTATGNFVLLDANSTIIWESFKHPTDTLLPSQIMEIGGMLSSRQSSRNFSVGRFQFGLLDDGNAVLKLINLPNYSPSITYYESGTTDPFNETNSAGYQVIFHAQGYLYVLRRNGNKSYITRPEDAVSLSRYYLRATLSFHGVLTLSYHPKNSTGDSSWKIKKAIPDDICVDLVVPRGMGTGPCGYNGICKLNNDGTPSCKCPPGYSFLHPINKYSGCRPDSSQFCDGGRTRIAIEVAELPQTDWPESDYEYIEACDVDECKKKCLLDCHCAGAIYSYKDGNCWKKRLPLSNGRESKQLNHLMAFVKFRNLTVSESRLILSRAQQNYLLLVVLMLLGASIFVNFVVVASAVYLGFLFYYNKFIGICRHHATSVKSTLRQFTYKELTEATNDFEEELGRGSCGVVFRGETELGTVAVKVMDRLFGENDKDFQAEVNIIGQTHHKNLVRLLGYCDEEKHRLLLYEFMSNGTLASFLFEGPKPSWCQRAQIAFGIARGLIYLHEECSTQIIHCDIKPQNVLLDECYNARISDFGLAKLLGLSQTHTYKTSIRGTKGYIAPDWFRSAPVSVKVDVYSFGVLLLEIVCCRRNDDVWKVCGEGGTEVLTEWAYECYRDGRLQGLVENDIEAMSEIKMVERFVKVAFWCLQEDPFIRPTMKKVLLMLEGILQVSPPPTPCSSTTIS